MKALKVPFKYIISAQNLIEEHEILCNNLYEKSSNYWIITSESDIVEKEIKRYFDMYGVKYVIEEVYGV